MAHIIRSKQSGVKDISAGLASDLVVVDQIARFGINSQISCLAYDPVQSLLAVGTRSTEFGPGQIYVFGKGRIQIVLPIPVPGASALTLQFCADKLISLDSKHDISIFSLDSKRLVTSHSPPGVVSVLCTDPMLDYAILGMETGVILAYDMDREALAPFKIPNLWAEMDQRARIAPIVSLQLHPRDVGTLLIGYAQGAVIYSFKLNKALRYFQYEVPRGAAGGDGDPSSINIIRRPRLIQAIWHPTGTFVMTGHEDSSIVFWDTIKDGRMLMARTLTDTNVASPGAGRGSLNSNNGPLAVKEPLFRMAWCANHPDPEDTAILVAGGQSTQSPEKGLTLFQMGRTPMYTTSSWEILTAYFESPKEKRLLKTPLGAEVVSFCLIPKTSPHFAGAHDPIAIIALLSSGELLTMSFPSGRSVSPTNQLHVSLTLLHPFVKSINTAELARERWLGLQERRQQGPLILQGGSETPHRFRRSENRNIVQTVHADGTIRLFDPGYGDEIENEMVLQVDVPRAVGNHTHAEVTQTSFAGASAELAVGLRSGEFVIFRWSANKSAGREPPSARPNQPGTLTSVTDRVDAALGEGLCPLTLLDQKDGPVTAVCMSEIGFAAAAFEGGSVVLIDLRGPAVILKTSVQEFTKAQKTGSLRRRAGSSTSDKPSWATHIQFSIMTLEGEEYSSILLHVGTNLGHLATFKVLPDPSGRYSAQYVGHMSLDNSKVIHIAPIDSKNGRPAFASQTAMGMLREGLKVNGVLITVTITGVHISRPPTDKGTHKTFDNVFCDKAAVVRYQDQGYALLGLFGDGNARVYSIPALREIRSINLVEAAGLDVRQFNNAAITPTGNVLGFTGPSELVWLTIWGSGEESAKRRDNIFDPNRLIPPRPTISTVQWVTGTQYITPSDMDILIGGPDRPPSKRMIAQAAADDEQRRKAGGSTVAGAAQSEEGYWAYMQRQIQERTEKLGIMGDNMDSLEQNSNNWLEDVNKFVGRQKRNAATGRKLISDCLKRAFCNCMSRHADLAFSTVIKARFGF